jgi:hypothetical protein
VLVRVDVGKLHNRRVSFLRGSKTDRRAVYTFFFVGAFIFPGKIEEGEEN